MADAAPTNLPLRPRIAVWKFASCDGCQMSLLDCEDELLAIAASVDLAFFPEASSAMRPGPYDVSLVEGSVSTPDDVERLRGIRRDSRLVVTIGACATAGGVQALRNTLALDDVVHAVYPHPEWIESLATSTPIADHVTVDAELRGCPIDKGALVELISALLAGRRPQLPHHPVCIECKAHGTPCVLVAGGVSCLGPVTQAGCGALCPRFQRGCYGCFGPAESPNTEALAAHLRAGGASDLDVVRLFRQQNGHAPAFHEEATRHA
jgi:coenzyme F420-reducing hydrogenase gamma subunit